MRVTVAIGMFGDNSTNVFSPTGQRSCSSKLSFTTPGCIAYNAVEAFILWIVNSLCTALYTSADLVSSSTLPTLPPHLATYSPSHNNTAAPRLDVSSIQSFCSSLFASASSAVALFLTPTSTSQYWEERYFVSKGWPNPKGLLQGLGGVVIGQVAVAMWYLYRRWRNKEAIYAAAYSPGAKRRPFLAALISHLSKPESFAMVFFYLVGVWMCGLLPLSYYDLTAELSWFNVFVQFFVIDFYIYVCHKMQHDIETLYRATHRPHHYFVTPTLFDAFDGSIPDTFTLILIPLFATSHTLPLLGVHVSHVDFAVFGCLYANQFQMIHCEYRQPWDWLFEMLSIGTSADHAVHHTCIHYNFGHFFMWFDKAFGTYRSPASVTQLNLNAKTQCLTDTTQAIIDPKKAKSS